MISRTLLPQLLFIGGALTKSTIQWGTCDDTLNSTFPLQCGKLAAPLDYTNPNSSATYSLELLRIPVAANTTSKGSVIFNYGGPGAPGIPTTAGGAEVLRNMVGPDYDLLSFNPRGANEDSLLFSCYPKDEDRLRVYSPDPLADTYFDSSDAAPGTLWAQSKVRADACFGAAAESGGLIGTAFVVRDIVQIFDALGEDLINYYGVSYGTVLGATLASMFPERVGRVVLDSVSNPHEYMNDMDGLSFFSRTDLAFSALLSQCVAAGPSKCPLSRHATIAADLQEKIFGLFDSLRTQSIPLPANLVDLDTTLISGTMVDYSTLKSLTFLSLYNPILQSSMFSGLDGVLKGNYTSLVAWRDGIEETYGFAAQNEAYLGIACGDKIPRSSDPDVVLPGVQRAENISRIAGGAGPSLGIVSPICAQWRMEAKERYQGDFNVETKNPVLLVGNKFDPATPIDSAYNVSSGLVGSRVVELNGIGHGAHNSASQCLTKIFQEYFGSGAMPQVSTCELDEPLLKTDGTLL